MTMARTTEMTTRYALDNNNVNNYIVVVCDDESHDSDDFDKLVEFGPYFKNSLWLLVGSTFRCQMRIRLDDETVQ